MFLYPITLLNLLVLIVDFIFHSLYYLPRRLCYSKTRQVYFYNEELDSIFQCLITTFKLHSFLFPCISPLGKLRQMDPILLGDPHLVSVGDLNQTIPCPPVGTLALIHLLTTINALNQSPLLSL